MEKCSETKEDIHLKNTETSRFDFNLVSLETSPEKKKDEREKLLQTIDQLQKVPDAKLLIRLQASMPATPEPLIQASFQMITATAALLTIVKIIHDLWLRDKIKRKAHLEFDGKTIDLQDYSADDVVSIIQATTKKSKSSSR